MTLMCCVTVTWCSLDGLTRFDDRLATETEQISCLPDGRNCLVLVANLPPQDPPGFRRQSAGTVHLSSFSVRFVAVARQQRRIVQILCKTFVAFLPSNISSRFCSELFARIWLPGIDTGNSRYNY